LLKKFHKRTIAACRLQFENNFRGREFLKEVLQATKLNPTRKGAATHNPTSHDKLLRRRLPINTAILPSHVRLPSDYLGRKLITVLSERSIHDHRLAILRDFVFLLQNVMPEI
jgi:hypothetical protein